MNKIIQFFEDLLKILASFSLLLLLIGYVDLKTYYNYFGINISPYISSSEILIASLDNLIIVVISLSIQLIIWLSLFKYLFEYTDGDVKNYWKGKRRPQEYDDFTLTRLFSSKKIGMLVLILLIAVILSVILKSFFPTNSTLVQLAFFLQINFWIFMCIYMLWLPITRRLTNFAKTQNHYNPKLIVSFAIFLPTFLLTVWVKNSWFITNQIRKYGNSNKVEIYLHNDSIISTNDSIRYLGRTENYVFFWNKNTWTSKIYPSGQVKEIINFKNK